MMAWAEESFRAAAMAMAEDDWPWPCFSDQLYQLDLEYSDILGSLDTGFCHGPPPAPLSEGPLVPLSCCYEGQFSGLQQQQQIGGVPEENGQQMMMQVPEIGRQEDHAGVENGAGSVRGRRGKGKGLPAKNLMAERRRRKKLNDRLFMLRSVVPKVSKTDRASILADAIDYLKELLQSINDLSAELMAADPHLPLPGSSKSTVSALPALPCRARQDQQSQYLNSEAEPAKVEVKTKEGKKVDIHMVCSARPGLLLSTIRALDGLGLDVKEAVISCLNGFSLDISQAEQQSGEDVKAEEIKALLLHTASYQTSV